MEPINKEQVDQVVTNMPAVESSGEPTHDEQEVPQEVQKNFFDRHPVTIVFFALIISPLILVLILWPIIVGLARIPGFSVIVGGWGMEHLWSFLALPITIISVVRLARVNYRNKSKEIFRGLRYFCFFV